MDEEIFPVVSEEGSVVGLVSRDSLRSAALDPDVMPLLSLTDLMTPPFFLYSSMNLHQALAIFLQSGLSQLPVVNEEEKPIGLVQLHDIMKESGDVKSGY